MVSFMRSHCGCMYCFTFFFWANAHRIKCPHILMLSVQFFQQFALLLQAPHEDAQMIIKGRFPVPRLVVCDQHGSQVCDLCTFYIAFSFCPFMLQHCRFLVNFLDSFHVCKIPWHHLQLINVTYYTNLCRQGFCWLSWIHRPHITQLMMLLQVLTSFSPMMLASRSSVSTYKDWLFSLKDLYAKVVHPIW